MSLSNRSEPLDAVPAQQHRLNWQFPRLDASDEAERARAALLYGGLLVLAAALLRFIGLADEPFWHDEVTMLNIGLNGWEAMIQQFVERGRPPVFVMIAVVWSSAFGTGEVISRIPSVIAGIISVGVLFHFGSLLFNQRVGFVAALIITVTEFHIYYSQTYRYYAVYVMFIILSFAFFWMMLKRGRWYDIGLYVLTTALAVYTHAHGVFAIAGQGAFLIGIALLRRDWRSRGLLGRWFASQILLLAVIFPALWIYFLRDMVAPVAAAVDGGGIASAATGGDIGPNWLEAPTVGSIVRALVRFLFFEWFYFTPFGVFAALGFLAVGTGYYAVRTGGKTWGSGLLQLPRDLYAGLKNWLPEFWLVVCWFLGMLMLPWVLSFVVGPMFFDRYVLGASPAYYLLLALLLFGIRRVIPTQVLMLAFLIALLPGLIAFYTLPDNERWDRVALYLERNAGPSDAIVVLTSEVHLAQPLESLEWYYSGHAHCDLYEDRLNDPETIAALSDCIADHERVWLVGLRWIGNYQRLAAIGLSSDLSEFFETFEDGRWMLAEAHEGGEFHLLGVYLYEERPQAELD